MLTSSQNQISTDAQTGLWPTVRGHIVAATGELIGTTLFLFYAFAAHLTAATQAGETAKEGLSSQTIVFISLGYGFSLLVNAWIFYRVCGGLFNPAVSPFFHLPQSPSPKQQTTH